MADKVRRGRSVYPWLPGESHGRAKLTDAVVLEIRRRAAAGEHQETLAREFGIHQTHVSLLARGVIWAHLPSPRVGRRRLPGALHLITLRAAGWSWAEIAQRYDASPGALRAVLARQKPPRAARRALAQPLDPGAPRSIAPAPPLPDLDPATLAGFVKMFGGLKAA